MRRAQLQLRCFDHRYVPVHDGRREDTFHPGRDESGHFHTERIHDRKRHNHTGAADYAVPPFHRPGEPRAAYADRGRGEDAQIQEEIISDIQCVRPERGVRVFDDHKARRRVRRHTDRKADIQHEGADPQGRRHDRGHRRGRRDLRDGRASGEGISQRAGAAGEGVRSVSARSGQDHVQDGRRRHVDRGRLYPVLGKKGFSDQAQRLQDRA